MCYSFFGGRFLPESLATIFYLRNIIEIGDFFPQFFISKIIAFHKMGTKYWSLSSYLFTYNQLHLLVINTHLLSLQVFFEHLECARHCEYHIKWMRY